MVIISSVTSAKLKGSHGAHVVSSNSPSINLHSNYLLFVSGGVHAGFKLTITGRNSEEMTL